MTWTTHQKRWKRPPIHFISGKMSTLKEKRLRAHSNTNKNNSYSLQDQNVDTTWPYISEVWGDRELLVYQANISQCISQYNSDDSKTIDFPKSYLRCTSASAPVSITSPDTPLSHKMKGLHNTKNPKILVTCNCDDNISSQRRNVGVRAHHCNLQIFKRQPKLL